MVAESVWEVCDRAAKEDASHRCGLRVDKVIPTDSYELKAGRIRALG